MTTAERLLALVQEIEVRPGQNAESLAKRFGCSIRTIQRDINQRLPELGVVVVYQNGYRFFCKPFLRALALTHEEVVSITLAQQIAEPHLDNRTSSALKSVTDKIRRGLNGRERKLAERLEERTAARTAAETESDTAPTLFNQLTEAIAQQLVVTFDYQGRSDQTPERRKVEPLGLFFQEKRWYLHAFDLNRDGTRTFRLGRMSELAVTSKSFHPREAFSAEKAGFHQWDIAEREPTTLELRLNEGLERWFQENRPHPSVSLDGCSATITVSDPEAFLRWFASLDDAEVVAPKAYRRWFQERLTTLQAVYTSEPFLKQ